MRLLGERASFSPGAGASSFSDFSSELAADPSAFDLQTWIKYFFSMCLLGSMNIRPWRMSAQTAFAECAMLVSMCFHTPCSPHSPSVRLRNHSLAHPTTCSLTLSPKHSLTHSLTQTLARSLTQTLTHSLTQTLARSLTPTTHPPKHSPTHKRVYTYAAAFWSDSCTWACFCLANPSLPPNGEGSGTRKVERGLGT